MNQHVRSNPDEPAQAARKSELYPKALVANLAIVAIGFWALWRGGLTQTLTHNALGIVGVLILLYRTVKTPPPSEAATRQQLMVVAAVLAMMLVTG